MSHTYSFSHSLISSHHRNLTLSPYTSQVFSLAPSQPTTSRSYTSQHHTLAASHHRSLTHYHSLTLSQQSQTVALSHRHTLTVSVEQSQPSFRITTSFTPSQPRGIAISQRCNFAQSQSNLTAHTLAASRRGSLTVTVSHFYNFKLPHAHSHTRRLKPSQPSSSHSHIAVSFDIIATSPHIIAASHRHSLTCHGPTPSQPLFDSLSHPQTSQPHSLQCSTGGLN